MTMIISHLTREQRGRSSGSIYITRQLGMSAEVGHQIVIKSHCIGYNEELDIYHGILTNSNPHKLGYNMI